MNATTVEYRTIDRLPGYRFGSDGSVWSCKASWRYPLRAGEWRRLAGSISRSGYRVAGLYTPATRMKVFLVNRLILEAFVGPCPDGMECRHLDGVPLNNRRDNLEWNTHTENMRDRKRHGTDNTGERHPKAKLTEAMVREARLRASKGERVAAIAWSLGASRIAIYGAVRRKTWKHVQ